MNRGVTQVSTQTESAAKNQGIARSQSDALLLEARCLLARGDLHNAQIRAEQANGLGISYGALDDSPAKVEALIQKANKLPTNIEAADSEPSRRQRAEVLNEEIEALLRWHDFDEAQSLAVQIQQLDLHGGPLDPNAQQLMDRITAARRTAENVGTGLVAAAVNSAVDTAKQRATDLTRQARAEMAQGDWVAAEQIARDAESLAPDTAFAPTEDRPALVLLEIQRVKRGQPAMGTPASRATGGVVQASAVAPIQSDGSQPQAGNRYPEMQALYDASNDATHNSPASATGLPDRSQLGKPAPLNAQQGSNFAMAPVGGAQPSPDNGTGEGLRWYRTGEAAIAKLQMDEALQAFRRAYAFQTELDPATRQKLYEHLKSLGEAVEPLPGSDSLPSDAASQPVEQAGNSLPPATMAPAMPLVKPAPQGTGAAIPAAAIAPPIAVPMPLDLPSVSAATLSRQVAAEVTRQQSLAREMREKRPKQALELLQRTRQMVASVNGMDQPAREQLLRRLDLSINDLQQYIAANLPEIEQEEKNRQVQTDVDRTRKEKVETDEKVASLVKDFNKMLDEQRYAEAQVIAKRTTELDPENPVVVQLNVMAKMVSRVAMNQQIQDQQEQGVWSTLEEVDRSAIPFAGEYQMPEAKKWSEISKSKFRQQHEGQLHRSAKEQEIEQRLSTPVALKFERRPLAEVIEYLGKIAQVPTYLDPQGLQAEGVGSDTPISIDLSQDISLKSALKLILEPLRLTYVIKDEVLKVTSEDVKRGQLYTVMYPVGDLVIRIPNFAPTGQEGINGAFREAMARMGWGGAAGGSFGAPSPALAVNEPGGNSNVSPAVLAQMRIAAFPFPSAAAVRRSPVRSSRSRSVLAA